MLKYNIHTRTYPYMCRIPYNTELQIQYIEYNQSRNVFKHSYTRIKIFYNLQYRVLFYEYKLRIVSVFN